MNRLKQDLSEERRRREFAERDSARLDPLNMKVGKLAEENTLVTTDNDNLRNQLLKLEGESRASVKMKMERDDLRLKVNETSSLIGQQKAEIEELQKNTKSSNNENHQIQNDLKVEKDLNLDLRMALDKMKAVHREVEKRKNELLVDLKAARKSVETVQQEKEELYVASKAWLGAKRRAVRTKTSNTP